MLIINAGSSSIKFAVFNQSLKKITAGKIDNIGQSSCSLHINGQKQITVNAANLPQAAAFLIKWFKKQDILNNTPVITHRVVHGIQYNQPQIITAALLRELKKITAYDPDHMPGELALINTFKKYLPHIQQVACFDTAFHSNMPLSAAMLPVPYRFYKAGIKKYGFHGLSYTYIIHKLKSINPRLAKGKLIVAHLGNGASIAAIKNGKSIDTSMGFTPAGGLVMSSRSGDIDPGLAWYIMKYEKLTADAFNKLINHQSGLLGISGVSSSMQVLLQKSKNTPRAKTAVDIFCYCVKKYIGAYSAILEGLDGLVFTGGIGENASAIRAKICSSFNYLGIDIDEDKNRNNSLVISTKASRVPVYVIPTDEEYIMAKQTKQLLGKLK